MEGFVDLLHLRTHPPVSSKLAKSSQVQEVDFGVSRLFESGRDRSAGGRVHGMAAPRQNRPKR